MNVKSKSILFGLILCLSVSAIYAQEKKSDKPENWFNLDLQQDGVFGISTEKAYKELLKNKKPKQTVLVAIIDSGVDTVHEDLKSKIWINPKEIPHNGIDDDKNGFIDDVHGWSFLGSAKGNLTYDQLEMVRLLQFYKPKYESVINDQNLDSVQKKEFKLYQKLLANFGKEYNESYPSFGVYSAITETLNTIKKQNDSATLTEAMVMNYKALDDDKSQQVYSIIKRGIAKEGFDKFLDDVKEGYNYLNAKVNYQLNLDYKGREEFIGDDYNNQNEAHYGNQDVQGPDAMHGTHVAGIIGADRNNNKGIKGVADQVLLMSIRTVPDGDERDKDVANAIRYAVDMGAKVVNMSFGKSYKWNKKIVDDAVKYAEEKGVLLIHAAGNDNNNNDLVDNFPNKYLDTTLKANRDLPELNSLEEENDHKLNFPTVSNWIEVGASDAKNDDSLKASFSNYGKYSVDVFAPGVKIHATVPGNKYKDLDGTSMATPVVVGLSSLILSYYPKLSPADVKDIIMQTVVKVTQQVKLKDKDGKTSKVPFTDLCVSGGIVNAFNALKLAEKYKPSKKKK